MKYTTSKLLDLTSLVQADCARVDIALSGAVNPGVKCFPLGVS